MAFEGRIPTIVELARIDTVLACKLGCCGGTKPSVAREITIPFVVRFSRVIAVLDNDWNRQADTYMLQDSISSREEVSRVSMPSLLLRIP